MNLLFSLNKVICFVGHMKRDFAIVDILYHINPSYSYRI